MDDKFLYENRPPVRKGFGENLYARISINKTHKKRVFNWAMAIKYFVTSIVVIVSMITASDPVRANVLYWIRQIAGLQVQEMDTLPNAEKEITVPADVIGSFELIRKDLPYEVYLPAFVPDGFIFQENVIVQDQSIFLHWINKDKDEILMLVDVDHGQRYLTGKDAAQEIQVNGQPAMLFKGGYDQNHNWDPAQNMVNLLQKRDDVIYWLIFIHNPDGTFDSTAAKDVLIQMMNSLVLLK